MIENRKYIVEKIMMTFDLSRMKKNMAFKVFYYSAEEKYIHA